MGAAMFAFMRICIPPGNEKGLAGEGKTLDGLLKSWVEPRKTIKRA
jgi:hypothetical protein